ncbi:MAG TPA: protein-L-isoaspartate(D-aspartate) O-methyltransferase [Candidatus Eisenbacteria bacterium]|nr:protein-L-isoaspartate(D-aspartate) O-methyltransferase [Candidatus Eisenbacteria bacterium]
MAASDLNQPPEGFRFEAERARMVDDLARRGIRDPRVLDGMRRMPRHLFVDETLEPEAYGDTPLPTAAGQTISQPWMVARMLELSELAPWHRVLEIGTGSGYQTALLAALAREVWSVERVPELLEQARARIAYLGLEHVHLALGDGSLGWPEAAPYDRVLVAAAAPRVPEALKSQVGERGLLVIPVGGPKLQHLEVWRRQPDGTWGSRRHGECRFVPLLGREAWPEQREPAE